MNGITPAQYVGFDVITRVTPAFDCILNPCKWSPGCSPGSGGSHGRGSVRMFWIVRKDSLAVQFGVSAGWDLPQTEAWIDSQPSTRYSVGSGYYHPYKPMAFDLGYHSPRPFYADQDAMECDLIEGGQCFYDGSGLNAEEPWEILRRDGLEPLLDFMVDYWSEVNEWDAYADTADAS